MTRKVTRPTSVSYVMSFALSGGMRSLSAIFGKLLNLTDFHREFFAPRTVFHVFHAVGFEQGLRAENWLG